MYELFYKIGLILIIPLFVIYNCSGSNFLYKEPIPSYDKIKAYSINADINDDEKDFRDFNCYIIVHNYKIVTENKYYIDEFGIRKNFIKSNNEFNNEL